MKLNISDLSMRPSYNPLIALVVFIIWPIFAVVAIAAMILLFTFGWFLVPFGRLYRNGNKWEYKL